VAFSERHENALADLNVGIGAPAVIEHVGAGHVESDTDRRSSRASGFVIYAHPFKPILRKERKGLSALQISSLLRRNAVDKNVNGGSSELRDARVAGAKVSARV
jgi:hypothetical protein